ncbi:glycerophosphodiester phosphodiesterase [Flavobacterium sp. NRK F10]|uniref:glycerophosphodiester phosphodiesterase n=1 Tax=Flavobacterium sp. NRK F10 TaxID=2954931 RepID=UPI0020907F47|nr:glycerophosphodiester phosphodiesterase family protein [Flavobacterium sp. NRK F10]MCO6174484.1 glycerophosphodiester phosphodiesterase [Flavobacterium sp. NRK F10]
MFYIIGHRGASGHITENTLESIQRALDLNVDAIEIDVHVCASGEVVVFHDFTLDRLTDTIGAISDFSLEELKKIKIKDTFYIPTLEEVLHLVNRKCWINIELKGEHTAVPVFKILEKYISDKNWKTGDFVISSFQYSELKTFSQFNSEIPVAVLTQASIDQAIELAVEFKASAIHPHFSLLTKESCDKAKEMGFKINTWTVNNFEDIEHIKRFPIDGIITDFPDRI